MVLTDIKLAEVVTTGGTQSRVELSETAVAEYGAAMADGISLPPIVVFHDGSSYWLADGFHRVMAAIRTGIATLQAEVHKGAKRDAILYSVGANSTHGLPRTNADKRRAVTMLLQDEEWAQWSDREIARRCSVSHNLVSSLRPSLSSDDSEKSSKSYTTKHGTVATMRTENIGRSDGQKRPTADNYKPREHRVKEIAALAGSGHRVSQICAKLNLGEQRVRDIARQEGIHLVDADIKTRRIDYRRVIEQTVLDLDTSAKSLETIGVSFEGISPEEARDWAGSVADALSIFRKFHKQLLEVSRV